MKTISCKHLIQITAYALREFIDTTCAAKYYKLQPVAEREVALGSRYGRHLFLLVARCLSTEFGLPTAFHIICMGS